MFLVYYDESGDDGNPGSSELFVLSALAIHHQNWHETFQRIKQLRDTLHQSFNLPKTIELHTRNLILNKRPYHHLRFSDATRINILDYSFYFMSTLNIKFTNVAILKKRIISPAYKILDTAVTYSIQRLENTIASQSPGEKYLIITDEGRVEKMRATARRIQRINYIPNDSGFGSYNQEIRGLIEDPLPKKSDQSYFIQLCDMMSYSVSLYLRMKYNLGHLPGKLHTQVDLNKVEDWLNMSTPVLNLNATRTDKYGFGIVGYP